MTQVDPIEARLRRTFRVVAERTPIQPAAVFDTAAHTTPPPRRGWRVAITALVVALTAGAVTAVVAYGPRSSTAPPPPVVPGRTMTRIVFTTDQPDAIPAALAVVQRRAQALFGGAVSVTTAPGPHGRGQDIAVTAPESLALSQLYDLATTGALYLRPVLCGAPADQPGTALSPPASSTPVTLPACAPQYQDTAANLGVSVATQQPAHQVPPDPQFAAYPSTPASQDEPHQTVLLAPASGSAQQYPRFVLGPAQMVLTGVTGASALFIQSVDGYDVHVTLDAAAAQAYDAVAQQNFHAYVAFDLDGAVLEAPLIEPASASFASFEGQLDLRASFTAAEAKTLAAIIASGPLPVRLSVASVRHVPS